MIEIMGQLVRELEVRVNQSLNWTLPLDTFKSLRNFLISFSSVPNICPLPQLLETQTQTLIRLTLDSMFEGDEAYQNISAYPAAVKCMTNISTQLIQNHHKRITSALERQLQDLTLFSHSMKLTHEVLNAIRHHKLSRSCVTAITRMTYCGTCGGYGNFKPCLFMCINTLRGCFADLAEIQPDFVGLTAALRSLSKDLVKQLAPLSFVSSYLNQFVMMIEELRDQEDVLREAVSYSMYRESDRY